MRLKMAACLIVKNEVSHIAEWLAYQAVLGFDTCIVLDNGSNDRTSDVVRGAQGVQDIRLHPWTQSDISFQTNAYQAVCKLYGAEFDWIAFFDVDEFLVVHGRSLEDWLLQLYGHASVCIPWAVFGSSGHIERPKSLMIEAFTRRSLATFPPNRHVKSIVRPWTVGSWANPHLAYVGGSTRGPARETLTWDIPGVLAGLPDFSTAQVNHYFCRSKAHWAARVARQTPNAPWVEADFAAYDMNDVEDLGAYSASALVRAQMALFRVI